jgi:hypothetical protein
MGHTLIVEIPEKVYEPLLRKAKEVGQTPEKVVADWLANAVQSFTDDPLLQLAGIFESEVQDVAEKHDEYIGQGLVRKLRGSNNG